MSDAKMEKLAEVLKDGLGKKNKMPLRRHRDDDYWDSIDIEVPGPSGVAVRARIVPRYKTSGLSGDEWRISAVLSIEAAGDKAFARPFHRMRGLTEHAPHFLWNRIRHLLGLPRATMIVRRKSVVLMQQSFATLGDAVMGMGWHIVSSNEGSSDAVPWHHLTDEEEREHCQQVGCSELPKNFYRLNRLMTGDELAAPKYDWTPCYTWFCSRHTTRGDCGMEDADANLILVDGNGVPMPHAGDESPSSFGGVIELSDKP